MELSPLQLKHYHFTEMSVRVVQGLTLNDIQRADAFYPSFDGVEWDTNVQSGDVGDDDSGCKFVVFVQVAGNVDGSRKFPYAFSASAEGVFEIRHDGEMEERKRIVVVNGAGVLFGAIREQLLQMTSRCAHGAILLPTLDFRRLVKADEKAVQRQDSGQSKGGHSKKKPAKTGP